MGPVYTLKKQVCELSCSEVRQKSDTSLWPDKHKAWRKQHNLPEVMLQKWSNQALLQGLGKPLSSREVDLIDTCYAFLTSSREADEVKQNAVVDVSQSLDRTPWCMGKVRSLTTSSRFYVFACDMMLTAEHLFALLGFGEVNLEPFHGRMSAASDLAAEAMSVPSVGQLLALSNAVLAEDP